jgi:dihydrofolate reductase
MRRIVLQQMMSLDGFMSGPNGEFDWPLADEEFEWHVNGLLASADTLLLGRNTYQMFSSYWPTALSDASGTMKRSNGVEFAVPTSANYAHEEVARKMNGYRKIVFSRTLDKVEWKNSILVNEVVPEEIRKWKEQPGKNMALTGSAELSQAFMRADLIDDLRLWVNPVILGKGKPLFGAQAERRKLRLSGTRTFGSGLIELYYQSVQTSR